MCSNVLRTEHTVGKVIKMRYGPDSSGTEFEPEANSLEHYNETVVSVKKLGIPINIRASK
jgi:hypothetical protein